MTDNNNLPGMMKCYIVVNVGLLTPTENQWRTFFQQAATKPLASAIIAAARSAQNFISASKRSQNASVLLKNTLVVFEVASTQVSGIVAVINAQAALRGILGTTQQKGMSVLQAELREAAVDMGLTALQSQQITMTVVSWGERVQAIGNVQAYLVANTGVWYS